MTRYYISMKVEEGWSDWREVDKATYDWAWGRRDYITKESS